jgi:hypothetical protein
MADNSYDEALAEYRAAKAALDEWAGGYGPAGEVTAAEERMAAASWRLAELAAERGGDVADAFPSVC